MASAVVELVRHPEPVVPPDVDRSRLHELVRTAFGQRRKMLRRSLAGTVPPAAIAGAGLDERSRPEDLDLDDWIALARAERR